MSHDYFKLIRKYRFYNIKIRSLFGLYSDMNTCGRLGRGQKRRGIKVVHVFQKDLKPKG